MTRKALIVGIDHYDHVNSLNGCIRDARAVNSVLERHTDGAVNFVTPQLLIGSGPDQSVTRRALKDSVRELFADDAEIALFYFAGHGYIEDTGGYLCASDCESADDGFPLSEVMTMANSSAARNKVIILDSCHGGIIGDHPLVTGLAELSQGVTILTASTEDQYALETPGGSGVFTSLLEDALRGAAANLVGDVTPGSVYAHIDQSLGPWAQRPIFKTNVKRFISLRKTKPPIDPDDLSALTTHFPTADYAFSLDPTFEPERPETRDDSIPDPIPENTAIFEVLQNYVKVNLVRPVGAPHMWHAAMQYKSCELTVLGKHYWKLVSQGLI